MNLGMLYAESRQRMVELASGLSDDEAARTVPGCPAWSVQDLLAHLAGLCADLGTGTIDGAGTDPWTAVQVADRRERALPEVLAEWQELSPGVEALLPQLPGSAGARIVIDLVTHEHDLRGALGRPGARDAAGVELACTAYADRLGRRVTKAGLPAVQLEGGSFSHTAGAGEPAATVRADSFELFRALSGRRSAAQVLGYDWDGDAAPYVDIFSNFGPLPADDVLES